MPEGQGEIEFRQTELDALPFRLRSVQGVGLAGIGGPQWLGVVAAGVVPVGLHAIVAVAIGDAVAVLVAVPAGEGDGRHAQSAGRQRFAGLGEQHVASFDRGDRIVAFAQVGEEIQI